MSSVAAVRSNSNNNADGGFDPFLMVYASAELFLALQISLSNFVVIVVYLRSRHIRTPTNAYIFSLALTDFLAGALGIPFTVASVLTRWPSSYYACLAIHLILCVLCTVSTLHLLAMAIDKYLTICMKRFDHHHSSSSFSSRKSRANLFIIASWLTGTAIAGLPMVDGFGFASRTIGHFHGECHFTVVVDYRYLVFVIFFATIILPSAIIALCYVAIYSHIRHEEHQIKCLLRASERQRRINSRRKLVRILLILVLTYAICWYPLYLINTADLFLPSKLHAGRIATLSAVVLSHLNCALNPLIYAYGVPGFKHSLRRFLPMKTSTFSQGGITAPYNTNSTRSPYYFNYGMPTAQMGMKRTGTPTSARLPQQQQTAATDTNNNDNNNSMKQNQQKLVKFSRTVSGTLNTPPVGLLPVKIVSVPSLTAQLSTQSLLETRREQFRRQRVDNNNNGAQPSSIAVAAITNAKNSSNSNNSRGMLLARMQKKWSTNDTEEEGTTGTDGEKKGMAAARDSDDEMKKRGGGGGTAGEERTKTSTTTGSSLSSSSCTSSDEQLITTTKGGGTRKRQTSDDGNGKRTTSIASKVSQWSVRIFNGQWLMRRSSGGGGGATATANGGKKRKSQNNLGKEEQKEEETEAVDDDGRWTTTNGMVEDEHGVDDAERNAEGRGTGGGQKTKSSSKLRRGRRVEARTGMAVMMGNKHNNTMLLGTKDGEEEEEEEANTSVTMIRSEGSC